VTKRTKAGNALSAGQSASQLLLALLGVAAIPSAMAAVDLSGGVSVGGEYNTNATQLAEFESPAAGDGSTARDDIALYASASVLARTTGQGPLNAEVQAAYTHSESLRQESLSRDDYTFSVSVNWRPSQLYDVTLRGTQNRLPLGLADIGGQSSVAQTSSGVQGTVRVRPTPRWQLSLTPGWTETKTPREDTQTLRLRETSYGASIEFLGAGRLVPGIGASQSQNVYSGVEDATRYKQRAVYGSLGYRFTDVTAFALTAGQTTRTTTLRSTSTDPSAAANAGDESAFTGSLSFNRRLTAKTSVDVSVFRGFQVYDAGVNTSIGTGFRTGVNWAATRKISASLSAAHIWSTIENVPVDGVPIQRKDLERSYSLGTRYLATRLTSISANVTRNIRNSQVGSDQYNSTVASLSLSVSFD
jgi:hypothetical protein